MKLWSSNNETDFFKVSLEKFLTPGQLFYYVKDEYYAYIPKGCDAEGRTLNSRNALVGRYTENWCKAIFDDVAQQLGLFAVNGVICPELGLTSNSPADLAFCATEDVNQKLEGIKLLFEIKMSIISNYKFTADKAIEWIGDFHQHKGNPSLLRSDSMLKAIGKAINIRVSCPEAAKIPILVLGNSPITKHYIHKVDFLKTSGVLQGFWSLYPKPTEANFIRETPEKGFITILTSERLLPLCKHLVKKDLHYFSSMLPKQRIGELIRIASEASSDIAKAEKFLQLIKG